jgi:hypothetical protein
MSLLKFNPVEPPWYGPVCPVVWEGRHREVSPYPDLVVKALGIGFFEAARKGDEEAAKELGNVELIYTGPTTTTAEGQTETLNALIAQRVNAIAVTANDTDALVPILKKAMQRKIAASRGTAPSPLKGARPTSTRQAPTWSASLWPSSRRRRPAARARSPSCPPHRR